MRVSTWIRANWWLLAVVCAFGTCSLIFPSWSHAQCPLPVQGNNAVYNPNCNPIVVGSSAFIDASAFLNSQQGVDICDAIYGVLTSRSPNPPYPATGAVIDARGITTSLTCTQGSPWKEGSVYANVPSTILLPAGTITIAKTWILPNGTRVIGEGSTNPYDAITAVPQTTIQASSSLTGAMIQFGDSSCPSPGGCLGVTLEDVTLNGSDLGINGIVNSNSQELSYAKNVTDRFARPGPRIVRLKLGNGGTNRDFRDLLRNRTGDGREDVICV